MSLERSLAALEASHKRLRDVQAARLAVVNYSRDLISRDKAKADLIGGGWTEESAEKLLAVADRNLKRRGVNS